MMPKALLILSLSLFAIGCGDKKSSGPGILQTTDRLDGEPCSGSASCAGDFCLSPEEGFPQGYCTTTSCADTGCSHQGAACVHLLDGRSFCAALCQSPDDCRTGYNCQPIGSSAPVCTPTVSDEEEPIDLGPAPIDWEDFIAAFDPVCATEQDGVPIDSGHRYTMDFVLDPEANSFMMVPFVYEGLVVLDSFAVGGQEVDVRTDYRHHNTGELTPTFTNPMGQGIFGQIQMDWPLLVPYAPQFSSYVQPGARYTVTLDTDRSPPCLYVATGEQGRRLRIRFYLADIMDLRADDLRADEGWQEILTRLTETFEEVSISLQVDDHIDLPASVASRFALLRSMQDVHRVTAYGTPLPDYEESLVVDVFLVRDILLDGVGPASGYAPSLPGAVGMHGNTGNGITVSMASFGNDNRYLSNVIAHELGHYLGLRHTTEILHGLGGEVEQELERIAGTTDPIEDTPVCDSVIFQQLSCPDARNLMFPVAVGRQELPMITPDQAAALRANPFLTTLADPEEEEEPSEED